MNPVSERSASSVCRIKKLAEKHNATRKIESLYAAFNREDVPLVSFVIQTLYN